MIIEITTEYAIKVQKEPKWVYNKADGKVLFSNVGFVFLRIKSHLSMQVLKKVVEIDKKRVDNENRGVEFNQETWSVFFEAWTGPKGFALTRIEEFYGLGISDMDISIMKRLGNDSSPEYTPSN